MSNADSELGTEPTAAETVEVGSNAAPGEFPSPFEPGDTFDRYVILETLGAGGMGVVVSAFDVKLDRRIALKVLHPKTSADATSHARLIREAKALARLSHPRVVEVYDVGECDGQVFIAMEFIDGPNLRTWLRASSRSTEAVLEAFRDAARGLQAAHEAGIVHRDFKPDNVLIGPDGHARVTDFGLALEREPMRLTVANMTSGARGRLTESGAVMGTPAYMSLEQHRGQPTDHRSDQYSFCVSLYEALYGRRPFQGANAIALAASIEGGSLPRQSPDNAVSAAVHDAIRIGLSANPDARHASMEVLLRALTPPRRPLRTWLLGSVTGLAVGAGVVALTEPRERPCSAFDERIAQTYDAGSRAKITAAFEASELPYASSTLDATLRGLDAFSDDWVLHASDACRATERGEQSEAVLDLRMLCLERGRVGLEATVEVLEGADAGTVRSAPTLLSELRDPSTCSDQEALERLGPMPTTPAEARDAEQLLPELARVRTLLISGRKTEAQALYEGMKARLDAATHPLVVGYGAMIRGRLAYSAADDDAARTALSKAYLLALEHQLDELAAAAASQLGLLSVRESDFSSAHHWHRLAVPLARASKSKRIEARILGAQVVFLRQTGKLDAAIEASKRALELVESDADYPAAARAQLLLSHAGNLHRRYSGDAGSEYLAKAQELLQQVHGQLHPVLLDLEQAYFLRAALAGDRIVALEHAEVMLRMTRALYGNDHPDTAAARHNLGTSLSEAGRFEDALAEFDRADATWRRLFGDDNPQRAVTLANEASMLTALRRDEEAYVRAKQAVALIEGHEASNNDGRGVAFAVLASAETRLGRFDEARAHAERAREVYRAVYGERHFRIADVLVIEARIDLLDGDPKSAQVRLESALEMPDLPPADQGVTRALLARCILARSPSDEDRAAALALARLAEPALKQAPPYARELEELREALGGAP